MSASHRQPLCDSRTSLWDPWQDRIAAHIPRSDLKMILEDPFLLNNSASFYLSFVYKVSFTLFSVSLNMLSAPE